MVVTRSKTRKNKAKEIGQELSTQIDQQDTFDSKHSIERSTKNSGLSIVNGKPIISMDQNDSTRQKEIESTNDRISTKERNNRKHKIIQDYQRTETIETAKKVNNFQNVEENVMAYDSQLLPSMQYNSRVLPSFQCVTWELVIMVVLSLTIFAYGIYKIALLY